MLLLLLLLFVIIIILLLLAVFIVVVIIIIIVIKDGLGQLGISFVQDDYEEKKKKKRTLAVQIMGTHLVLLVQENGLAHALDPAPSPQKKGGVFGVGGGGCWIYGVSKFILHK